MKKLISFALLLMVTLSVAFAQQANELYRFKSDLDAEKLLKAISQEVKLDDNQFQQVKELLSKSYKSQANFFNSENAKDEQMANRAMMRQTAHIEGSLKTILGEEKFKQFEAAKASIAKQVANMK